MAAINPDEIKQVLNQARSASLATLHAPDKMVYESFATFMFWR